MPKVLRLLISYDLLTISSFGLLQPIFAIFLKEDITGASIASVGIASTIFLITKSVLPPFLGKIADSETGNKRKIRFLFIGSLLVVITPLIYIVATNMYHIYFAQFIYGLGYAFAFPAWYTLYTRFIDKNKEGYQWSIYDTTTGLAGALTAFAGGIIAQYFGFISIFILISLLCFLSLFIVLFLKKSTAISN
ncbi:MAG: MFS transporter [bacterium]|nr:MFS transporter [bacterium]